MSFICLRWNFSFSEAYIEKIRIMSLCHSVLLNNYDTQTKNINPTHTNFKHNQCAEIHIRRRLSHLFWQPRKPHPIIPLTNLIWHTPIARNWRWIQRFCLWQPPTHSRRVIHPTFRLYLARHPPQPHYLLSLSPARFQPLFWFHTLAQHKNTYPRLSP